MFSQAFLTEGKAPWWKLQSIFSMVRYFGGSEPLGWAFQWVLTAAVAVVLVLMWRSRVPYAEGRSACAGTLLTTPYLFMYDMMVLAIPVAFLVRIGSADVLSAVRSADRFCRDLIVRGADCPPLPLYLLFHRSSAG
jgi:hypothetical protein